MEAASCDIVRILAGCFLLVSAIAFGFVVLFLWLKYCMDRDFHPIIFSLPLLIILWLFISLMAYLDCKEKRPVPKLPAIVEKER